MPPEHLWEDPEGLEQWWKSVEQRREDGVPTSRGRSDGDDDSATEMVENDHARYLRSL